MATDVDDLPELDNQESYTAAREALDSARERMEELREEVPAAEAKVERLTEEVDETRVAVAAGDATDEDLEAAKAGLAEAEKRLEDLREEKEAQAGAVDRLESRLDEARGRAAGTIAEDYAAAAEAVMAQKARALRSLATALEKMQALKQRAAENGLRRDERVPTVTPAVKTRNGDEVGADRLRYRADQLDERAE